VTRELVPTGQRVAVAFALARVAASTLLLVLLHAPTWAWIAWLMANVRVRFGSRRRAS
jgi:hypothetical protein